MVAKNSSQLMLNLVNDILDYAQIESNTFILNIAALSLKQLLEDCISIL